MDEKLNAVSAALRELGEEMGDNTRAVGCAVAWHIAWTEGASYDEAIHALAQASVHSFDAMKSMVEVLEAREEGAE